MAKHSPTREERFWSKVDRSGPNDCWEWTASLNTSGYGQFGTQKGPSDRAHRYSYELENGAIPNGLCVLHRCDNRKCVNPAHLFIGTRQDNNADKIKKGRQRATGPRPGNAWNSHLTERDVELILLDRRPHEKIAVEYGVDRTTVGHIKRGVNWRYVRPEIARHPETGRIPKETKSKAKSLREKGMSFREIASTLGVSVGSVYRACHQ